VLDLRAPRCPLFDLGESVAQLGEFFRDGRLLGRGADALELPLFAAGAEAEREEVRVVALEGGAGGYGDESCGVSVRWIGGG
jgi:hypothetical protein